MDNENFGLPGSSEIAAAFYFSLPSGCKRTETNPRYKPPPQRGMEDTTPSSNHDQTQSYSRLAAARTFPVSLHHRNRSEVVRPTNHSTARSSATEERQPWPRRLFVDTSVDTEPQQQQQQQQTPSDKSKHSGEKTHRYSKSRDHHHRLPRAVNQIASAGGARNLLPTRTFHSRHSSLQTRGEDRNRDGIPSDLNFLKPIAATASHGYDSSRSRLGSRSSSTHNNSRSRAESLVVAEEEGDLNAKLSLTKGKEIRTMEDLNQAKKEREKGEEFLRSKLASIGTLATDITRRLDYAYYNLLERISALNSTIHTFQELVDSSAALHENVQRDNVNLEQDTHRQLEDFQNFEPQKRRIDALERRMKAGRSKMETLGSRLDTVRKEIEGWERREGEWQARVTRRLRVLWSVMGSVLLVVIVAYGIQSWRHGAPELSPNDLDSRIEMLSQQSRNAAVDDETLSGYQHTTQLDTEVDVEPFLKSPLLSKLSTAAATTTTDASAETSTGGTQDESHDPLRLFDEL